MTDRLGRRIKGLADEIETPSVDVHAVKERSRRHRVAQRALTGALAILLIGVGWTIGTRVGNDPTRSLEPSISSETLEILYAAPARFGGGLADTDIFVSSRDGSKTSRVADRSGADTYPVWSPDGTRIAFVSQQDEPGNVDVYVMNADGSGTKRLTTDPAIDTQPSWSPAGDAIAFSRSEGGSADIYTVEVDGLTVQRVTNRAELDEEPSWSPDGTRIAFASYVDDNQELFTIHPDGTGLERLTSLAGADWDPAWSPDGTKIAFSRDPDQSDDERGDLYVQDLETDQLKQVTSAPGIDKAPDWSPNGTALVYNRINPDGSRALLTIGLDANGAPMGPPKEIKGPQEAATLPDWKPN